jgi:hypothetical protein
MICTCNGCKKLWAEEAELRRKKPVTITISREDAEQAIKDLPEASPEFAFGRIALACQAALEGR